MMNRNVESHFSTVPHAEVPRSRFDRSHSHKTTLNTGYLTPIYVEEVLPADTFQVDVNFAIRMTTPLFPIMDNLYIDFYFFFVPYRLVWEHWEAFNGQPEPDAWSDPVEYSIPRLDKSMSSTGKYTDTCGVLCGSLADYLGYPVVFADQSNRAGMYKYTDTPITLSALPTRAYTLIYNEWFRDQNTQKSIPIKIDDSSDTMSFIYSEDSFETAWKDSFQPYNDLAEDYNISSKTTPYFFPGTNKPLRVNKFHDYFTSVLPRPQKGQPIDLPLAVANDVVVPLQNANITSRMSVVNDSYENMGSAGNVGWVSDNPGNTQYFDFTSGTDSSKKFSFDISTTGSQFNIPKSNIELNAVSISTLRQAFQLQKLFEKDARYGSRYTEVIRGHFGVVSPDSRLQRPEYLGGGRYSIAMSQVLQTSASDINGSKTPQGSTAAYSFTVGRQKGFTKSFTEHGIILGLCAVRQDHTYSQGIPKFLTRSSRFDFYLPVFACISEQPVMNYELYFTGLGRGEDMGVFGYQEAWADYRYKNNYSTAYMRPQVRESLGYYWTYADYFGQQPVLNSDFMLENRDNIQRTLTSDEVDDFICDFYFENYATRPMPVFSVPGLVDHF